MGIGLDKGHWLRRGRRLWWVGGGVVLAAVVGTSTASYVLTADGTTTPSKANTAKVDRGEVSTAVATIGSLEPAQTRSLSFATSGTVTQVDVRAGDDVKAGQVLAEIDAGDAQDKVDDAEEALAEAEDALDEAEEAADDASSSVCPASFGAADGFVLAAYRPSSSPTTTPFPTPSPDPDVSGSPSAPAATVTVTVTVTETVTVTPSPSPTSSSPPSGGPSGGPSSGPTGGTGQGPASSPTAPAGGNCAGSGGQTGQLGGDAVLSGEQRVSSAKLALAQARDALAGTKITAPIAGKVLTVAGPVGSDVSGGSTFVTVADVAGMQVSASFPEADAGRLASGQSATVTLANHPGEEFAARVVQLDPVGTADGDMVTYTAVLGFDDAPADLLVGQSANVKVKTSSVTDVLRVPSTAVRGADTVLVRTPNGDQSRQVVVGLEGDQFTELKDGLVEGDEIVVAES